MILKKYIKYHIFNLFLNCFISFLKFTFRPSTKMPLLRLPQTMPLLRLPQIVPRLFGRNAPATSRFTQRSVHIICVVVFK